MGRRLILPVGLPDLDGFWNVNDTYGHEADDALYQAEWNGRNRSVLVQE